MQTFIRLCQSRKYPYSWMINNHGGFLNDTFQAVTVFLRRFAGYFPGRSHVRYVDSSHIRWFPGHMRKGMNEIHSRMAAVDVIIEVHDARIPFSGRAPFIQKFGQVRPHILLLNKTDLAEPTRDVRAFRNELFEKAAFSNQHLRAVYFTQLNTPEKQKHLLRKLLHSLPRLAETEARLDPFETVEFASEDLDDLANSDSANDHHRPVTTVSSMAVGIPNSGKSTLINALRGVGRGGSGGAVRVGRLAGQTRSVGQPVVLARGVLEDCSSSAAGADSRLVMVDTPGILEPRVQSLPEQLSLAVCGALDLDPLDKELLVDYLLFWWNLRQRREYVHVLGLPGPTNDVMELLARVCARNAFYLQRPSPRGPSWQPRELETVEEVHSQVGGGTSTPLPDLHRAAHHILHLFNAGAFGRTTFLPADEEAAKSFFIPLPRG